MKTKVTNRLVRNPYLSEQEEKLAKFCEENGISFVKRSDLAGRGKTHYELDFKPEYLDETEARVSQHLDRTGIRYKFAIDKSGTHHYEFAEMIELEPLEKSEVVVDRAFVESRLADMPKLRRSYAKETKLLEDDTHVKEIKKQIETIKSKIEALKKNTDLVNWYHKLWYYVWKPYRTKVDDRIKKVIKKLEDEIRSKEATISQIEAERTMFREMLILADIIPDEEQEQKEKTPSYLKNKDELLKEVGRILDEWLHPSSA